MTPRNLDSHLKPLEKVGDVKLKKVLSDRSRTAVEIAQKGAQETGKYLDYFEGFQMESNVPHQPFS